MTTQQIREFVALVRNDSPADCALFTLTVESEGYDLQTKTADPIALKRGSITMRNLRGEWIEPQKKEAQ